MMSQKMAQSPAPNTADNDKPPSPSLVECSTSIAPGRRNKPSMSQRNGEATSSSPESGSLNGGGKRSGKSRRRKKRGANPEEKVDSRAESADKPKSLPAGLIALQAERANVWFERSAYERAESIYQCWLANSSSVAAKINGSPPGPVKTAASPPAASPTSLGRLCRHGDQVACHHLVQDVWVNKTNFDQAEQRFVREATQPNIPNSLDLQAVPQRTVVAGSPDEGYQSQVPTPATSVVPQAAATPMTRQPINGLPRIPMELLRDVWLEKPQYDRAEAAFYQNLCSNNTAKRAGCTRSGDHPQSLVEEEEEEEEEQEATEEKQVAPQGKAEAFHALQPIQEEEEPAEILDKVQPSGLGSRYFLHPDSERVWLDKWRYDAAESRFHGHRGDGAAGRRPQGDASKAASATWSRDNNMSTANFLSQEKIWFEKPRYDEAERRFYENLNTSPQTTQDVGANTILQDIARARENIQKSLAGLKTTLCNRGPTPPATSLRVQLSSSSNNNSTSSSSADQGELLSRISNLELQSQTLHKVVENLRVSLSKLECWGAALEKSHAAATQAPALAPTTPTAPVPAPAAPSVPYTNGTTLQSTSGAPKGGSDEDEDEDFDLFGSDEDDEEAERIKEQRLKEYTERKAKKPTVIAKSSILLDVKPWDDETDMAKLEECVRSVQVDGLLWGASKLLPVGYGIKKLQISCVVEDDKVGTDLLEEEITKFEDFVQSVDVAAFNKI